MIHFARPLEIVLYTLVRLIGLSCLGSSTPSVFLIYTMKLESIPSQIDPFSKDSTNAFINQPLWYPNVPHRKPQRNHQGLEVYPHQRQIRPLLLPLWKISLQPVFLSSVPPPPPPNDDIQGSLSLHV